MKGRPCLICSDSAKMRLAAELIASGGTDAAAAQLGVGRMAVARHRVNHIVAPAKAISQAAAKGQDVKQERAELVAAAQAGDPVATFIGLERIVGDLKKVHGRLERVASSAEAAGQHLAVGSLSSQQLRSLEMRAKIGGLKGYSPEKSADGGAQQAFVLNIHMGDRTEQIRVVGAAPAPDPLTIDADGAEDDEQSAGAALDALPAPSDGQPLALDINFSGSTERLGMSGDNRARSDTLDKHDTLPAPPEAISRLARAFGAKGQ